MCIVDLCMNHWLSCPTVWLSVVLRPISFRSPSCAVTITRHPFSLLTHIDICPGTHKMRTFELWIELSNHMNSEKRTGQKDRPPRIGYKNWTFIATNIFCSKEPPDYERRIVRRVSERFWMVCWACTVCSSCNGISSWHLRLIRGDKWGLKSFSMLNRENRERENWDARWYILRWARACAKFNSVELDVSLLWTPGGRGICSKSESFVSLGL